MCVWAHTFTNTPPLASKREHSHPFACAKIRFVTIIVIPQRGLYLQVIIPSNWRGNPLKSSLQHSGKELALVTSWAKRCNNRPQEFKSSKSCPEGKVPLPNTAQPPNPGEKDAESKVTGGREGETRNLTKYSFSPIHCPQFRPL